MPITHHPSIATLMSCAAGSQPEAQAAVVASHVAMCPLCRRELKDLELIGAAMFDDMPSVAVKGEAPVPAARALEAETPASVPHVSVEGDVPYPLRAVLPAELGRIKWKRLAPGIWHHPIPLSKGARGDLRLIKVAPGIALPEHGHGGEELTLLLAGSYRDELGTFRRGDVADLDDEVEHRPVADAREGCVCLIATERKARFKGLIARIMQSWTGL